jgi:adenylylsulfate kinase
MKHLSGTQKTGKTIWLFGLPCSGKTTIANALVKHIKTPVELLDGDDIRKNLSTLGFSKEDRLDNVRRIRWLCKLLNRNGINVIVSAITPYRQMRDENKAEIENYVEIWVKSPLDVCISRDIKGLYKKAIDGYITNMTGIQDPFEEPIKTDFICDTNRFNLEECIDQISVYLHFLENSILYR